MPNIEWTEVESTNLDMVGYDNDNEELHVKFKGGAEYTYQEVPYEVYQGLLNAVSKGKYLNQSIKGLYDCYSARETGLCEKCHCDKSVWQEVFNEQHSCP